MAGHANVENGDILRFLIYMEAASIWINPMGTLERRMATDARRMRRNRDRILQTAAHRMALARPREKSPGSRGSGWHAVSPFPVAREALFAAALQGKQVELLARSEKDAHGARNRHSDKEKFPSDLNRPGSYEMSERRLKTLRKSGDFQADYEGSIPFTRSKQFNGLARIFRFHSDNTADDRSKFVSVFRLAK
jgi:hypothetical protein